MSLNIQHHNLQIVFFFFFNKTVNICKPSYIKTEQRQDILCQVLIQYCINISLYTETEQPGELMAQ